MEAIAHFSKGLALLRDLPMTFERIQQELGLRLALGPALSATKGLAAPEVEHTYARARALCQQVGEAPQLFLTLRGLCEFYRNRGAMPTARELGEQLFRLAQREVAPTRCVEAHDAFGATLSFLSEYAAPRTHMEQGIALTTPTAQRALTFRYGVVPGVRCLALAALTLWCLGSPAQAEALLALATAQGFPLWLGLGTCWRGWALAMQGQGEAGLRQMRQGLAAILDTGQTLTQTLCLILLAEAMGHAGQSAEGLRLVSEALAAFEESGRGDMLVEAYRLQGELLLRQAVPDTTQAEACFQQALAIARRQQAKSWELRVAVSLSRLWQRQAKQVEARQLLGEVYGRFTEGFDTADLQEARALLEELGG